MIKVATTHAVIWIWDQICDATIPSFLSPLSLALSSVLSLFLSFFLSLSVLALQADDLEQPRTLAIGFCEFWISEERGNTFLVHASTVGRWFLMIYTGSS